VLLTVPSPSSPPAEIRPAPPTPAEREERLLEAYDWGHPLPPAQPGPGATADRWLRAAATFDPGTALPGNPFPPGAAHREAEALRALLKAPPSQLGRRLAALPLRQSGTALALWRWGQAQVRLGHVPLEVRQAWEDRLLAAGPALTRGYALRHALCWALADKDETRFAALKALATPETESVVAGFQRLFGLLGGPTPDLRLWSLPGLAYQDLRLDQLGVPRVWICPAGEGPLPDLPPRVAWVIPSAEAGLDARSASLPENLLEEGRALAMRLQAAGRTARFAPSRPAFEALGLVWFPILIDLDAQGTVRTIRMGDAAPSQP
jgi:hypothetical protein